MPDERGAGRRPDRSRDEDAGQPAGRGRDDGDAGIDERQGEHARTKPQDDHTGCVGLVDRRDIDQDEEQPHDAAEDRVEPEPVGARESRAADVDRGGRADGGCRNGHRDEADHGDRRRGSPSPADEERRGARGRGEDEERDDRHRRVGTGRRRPSSRADGRCASARRSGAG